MHFPIQLRRAGAIIFGTLALFSALYAFQRPFREYPGVEYEKYPLPRDFQDKGEWTFGRLMYPPVGRIYGGFELYGNWLEGGSNWTMDYPRSDRHLAAAVRRLTRIHARSVEQTINLDDGDEYDWPFLYGVEVGHWNLTDAQAARACASSCCAAASSCATISTARSNGMSSPPACRRSSPTAPSSTSRTATPSSTRSTIWTTAIRCPARSSWRPALTYEKGETGKIPHWRGIYDDHGRLMVVMCHNMDLGDSWEHADNPEYPEKFSALGIRIGMNYITYSMTH